MIRKASIVLLSLLLSLPMQSTALNWRDCVEAFNDYYDLWSGLRPPRRKSSEVPAWYEGHIVTSRSFEKLYKEEPRYLLPIAEMRGKTVLDIGCGYNADLVLDLRSEKIDAFGIDPLVEPTRRQKYLKVGSADHLPYEDATFDVVYSAWSVYSSSYLYLKSDEFLTQGLQEIQRVLKPGGQVRFYPLTGDSAERLKRLLVHAPALQVVESDLYKNTKLTILQKKR